MSVGKLSPFLVLEELRRLEKVLQSVQWGEECIVSGRGWGREYTGLD